MWWQRESDWVQVFDSSEQRQPNGLEGKRRKDRKKRGGHLCWHQASCSAHSQHACALLSNGDEPSSFLLARHSFTSESSEPRNHGFFRNGTSSVLTLKRPNEVAAACDSTCLCRTPLTKHPFLVQSQMSAHGVHFGATKPCPNSADKGFPLSRLRTQLHFISLTLGA